jgi:hypothetical protein
VKGCREDSVELCVQPFEDGNGHSWETALCDLKEAIEEVCMLREEHKKVLVCCNSGYNRAVAVCAGVLLHESCVPTFVDAMSEIACRWYPNKKEIMGLRQIKHQRRWGLLRYLLSDYPLQPAYWEEKERDALWEKGSFLQVRICCVDFCGGCVCLL